MTVAASIILAAVAGGVIFVLLDSWQRRADNPAVEPAPPSPPRYTDPPSPPGLWSGWARHRDR